MNFKQYLLESADPVHVDGGNRLQFKKKEKKAFGGKQARKGLKRLRKGTPLTAAQKKALKSHFENDRNLNNVAGELGSEYVGSRIYDNQEGEGQTPAEIAAAERLAKREEAERQAKIGDNKKARKKNITINSAQRKKLAKKITKNRSIQIDKNSTIEKKVSTGNLKVRLKRIDRESKKRSRDAEEEQ